MFIEEQMYEPYRTTFYGLIDANGEDFLMSQPCYLADNESERILTAMRQSRASDFHYNWQSKYAAFKHKMAAQMKWPARKWRLEYISPMRKALIKTYLKDAGRLIAQIPHDNCDARELYEIYDAVQMHKEELGAKIRDAVNNLDGGFWNAYDYCQCEDCGYLTSDYRSTVNDEYVCETCCNDNYRYSEYQDTYIYYDDAYSVYYSLRAYRNGDPDDYVTFRAGSHSGDLYEVDGSFFDQDTYYDVRAHLGYDDDEDDEDEEDSRDHGWLPEWHNARKDFIVQNASSKYPELGVELEVYTARRDDCVEALRSTFGDNVILEKDGSLNRSYGFEIISHPLGREEWEEFLPSLTAVLKGHKAVGYNEPAGNNYGIHVSLHRKYLSPLAEARMAMFLASEENADFVRAIAQRKNLYSPQIDIGRMTTGARISYVGNYLSTNYYDRRSRRKIVGHGKYCPINFKTDLAEFRIFQSTVNPSSIMKNLEFIWALHKWTLPASATGSSFHYRDFVKWLNTPARRKEFPQLTAFLSKKTYYGTNFDPIVSTWRDLMVKPEVSDFIEPISA